MKIPTPKLTILDAVCFTAEAWDLVKPSTITSCWSKTGIISPYQSYNIDSILDIPSDNDDENNKDIIQHLIEHIDPESTLTADEYINIDSTLQIEDRLSDDKIIALVNGEQVEEECSNSQVEQKIVAADAVKSIDILTTFLKQREMDISLSENFIYKLNQCKKNIHKSIFKSKVQSKISSYFTSK